MQSTTTTKTARQRRGPIAILLLCLTLVAMLGLPAPVAADEPPPAQTEVERLFDIARQYVGARFVLGATGPSQFDCSGFVFAVFREAGLLDRIGGKRRTAAGYHRWFAASGLASGPSTTLSEALPGDLLIWGRDKHTGIYIGNNWAISALINPYGVTEHKVLRWIPARVTAILHVSLVR